MGGSKNSKSELMEIQAQITFTKFGTLRTGYGFQVILNVQLTVMMEDVGINHIHSLLAKAGISHNTSSVSIVSIIGCKDRNARTDRTQKTFIDAANSIAGDQAFSGSDTV